MPVIWACRHLPAELTEEASASKGNQIIESDELQEASTYLPPKSAGKLSELYTSTSLISPNKLFQMLDFAAEDSFDSVKPVGRRGRPPGRRNNKTIVNEILSKEHITPEQR